MEHAVGGAGGQREAEQLFPAGPLRRPVLELTGLSLFAIMDPKRGRGVSRRQTMQRGRGWCERLWSGPDCRLGAAGLKQ